MIFEAYWHLSKFLKIYDLNYIFIPYMSFYIIKPRDTEKISGENM